MYFDQGWQLDENSKQVAIQVAKQAGVCTEGCTGNRERGLYLSMTATIQSLGSNAAPAIISATSMTASSPMEQVCGGQGAFARPPYPIPRPGDTVCIEGYVMVRFWIYLLFSHEHVTS